MSDVVIRVEHLSKSYQYGAISHGTLTKDFQSWWARVRGKDDPNAIIAHTAHRTGQSGERFWALHDVSFDVKQGARVETRGGNQDHLIKVPDKFRQFEHKKIRVLLLDSMENHPIATLEPSMQIDEFLAKWTGFLKGSDPDALKSQYLQEKYE